MQRPLRSCVVKTYEVRAVVLRMDRRCVSAVIPLAVFGLIMNLFGALVGGGYALTK